VRKRHRHVERRGKTKYVRKKGVQGEGDEGREEKTLEKTQNTVKEVRQEDINRRKMA